ncbi:hypothetical protein, partial [Pseudomonas sp. MPBD4-3]|uniref:hypothetical protein n=1 Tax=Pseudomonas sp. MPBD4-3 TaxID=2070575 RepID=UPI000CCA2930
GWIPLDPTPLVFRAEGHHWLEDKYELLSAFWYRYILSYDADARKELINFLEVNSLKLAKLVLELVGILLLILAIRRIMRKLIRYW